MSTHFEDAEKTVALACDNRGQGNPCLMFFYPDGARAEACSLH
jgi:hypothetical protein